MSVFMSPDKTTTAPATTTPQPTTTGIGICSFSFTYFEVNYTNTRCRKYTVFLRHETPIAADRYGNGCGRLQLPAAQVNKVVSGVSSHKALNRIGKLGRKPSGKQLQMQEEANGANTFARVRAR